MTENSVPISKLRRQIFTRKGVQPAKKTKRLQTVDEQPDCMPKTSKMKMLEYKYHIKLEVCLFSGSLSEVCRFLNNEVDRSTISKWRKRFRNYNPDE